MQAQKSYNSNLESAIGKLRGMSLETKIIIISLIDRLADAEGVSPTSDYRAPAENICHWLTKLR